MVYVTHDQLEAMTLSDRIVVMNHGVMQQVGTPEEIYSRPANRFVAEFIGTPSMNMIEGELRGGAIATFASPDFSMAMPNSSRGLVDGQEVVLGARPQDIALVLDDAAPATARGKVWVVELVGSESWSRYSWAIAAGSQCRLGPKPTSTWTTL